MKREERAFVTFGGGIVLLFVIDPFLHPPLWFDGLWILGALVIAALVGSGNW